jgi:predicted DNA-binding transcriptional regulator YafY
MKVSDQATRLLKLAQLLFDGQAITTRLIMEKFEVSLATAKRDRVKLEQCLPVVVARVPQRQGACHEMKVLTRARRTEATA